VFYLKKIKINLESNRVTEGSYSHIFDTSRVLEANFSDQIVQMEIGSAPDKNKLDGLFWKIGKKYILKGDHEGEDLLYGTLYFLFKKKKKVLWIIQMLRTLHLFFYV